MTGDNPNGADTDPALPALREELRELRPFLAEALTPEAVIDLSARVADLVARIGDEP